MKLALVYFQMIGTGGLERYLLGLARACKARGHTLELITARTDDAVETLKPAAIHRIDLRSTPKVLRQTRFSTLAARKLDEIDADLVLGFGRTVAQDIHRAGGGCHRMYSALLPWWRRWSLKNRLELRLERRLYTDGRTQHFVVNSAQVREQLHAAYGVPRERFTVIHTAVDTEVFRPATPEERAASRKWPPQLLFVSSHHRRKGLDTLLEALAVVPEAELTVAGAPLGRRYRAKIARLGLTDRVREAGHVTDMAALYRQADIFIHPTLYDACANTVLQAMASGLTCLVSSADGAHEFIVDGRNGFLIDPPDSPAALASKMRMALILSDPERASIGARARETMLPLSWNAHLDRWEAVFNRVQAEACQHKAGSKKVLRDKRLKGHYSTFR